jgi:hypothetical protein
MQTLPSIKRGDTFSFIASLKDSAGEPLTGVASKLKSQVRNKADVLYSELIITETEILGNYLFKAPDTSAYPTGTELYLDIEYTNDGTITSSETIAVPVVKDVTRNV